MIKSMTGFGSAKSTNERLEVVVEIKSLNSKSLDTSFRLPRHTLIKNSKYAIY
jgi:uncharacterized protein YicC (UPF0701 family)